MKFSIKYLPERKYFSAVPNDNSSWFKFVDKECPRVRILSKLPDPWKTEKAILMPEILKGKSDKTRYTLRLNLKLFPIQKINGEELNFYGKPLILYREYVKGYFPHMIEPCALFDAFPLEEFSLNDPSLWLIYHIPLSV